MSTEPVNVLIMAPNLGRDLSYVADVDPRVRVLDGNRPDDDELGKLLGEAEVLLLGFPIYPDIARRAHRLQWAQHTQAGVSNLWSSDLWDSDVTLTSSRGLVGATTIAEYAMAGVFQFARGLDIALAQKQAGEFTRDGYRMVTLRGATLGVIGLGGIGREVARIALGVGMRVIATRHSITEPQHDVDGVELVLPASGLHEVAAQSDFIVLCSQLTPETRGMIDASVFAAMKPGAVLVNVARGEEIDEDAMVAAVRSGHLRGALLDVFDGEGSRPPRQELLDTPGIVLTPHLSTRGEPDMDGPVKALFADNLRRYLDGEPLLNLVDRQRGY